MAIAWYSPDCPTTKPSQTKHNRSQAKHWAPGQLVESRTLALGVTSVGRTHTHSNEDVRFKCGVRSTLMHTVTIIEECMSGNLLRNQNESVFCTKWLITTFPSESETGITYWKLFQFSLNDSTVMLKYLALIIWTRKEIVPRGLPKSKSFQTWSQLLNYLRELQMSPKPVRTDRQTQLSYFGDVRWSHQPHIY